MGIITSKEVPKVLQEAMCQAYEAWCQRFGVADLPVAVRSSGVAEDMLTASFAGQYDSYLNVRGKEELINKVRLCWASAFNERCIYYRAQKKLGVLAGSVSVVVQKMVNARSAGVGFTVDPDTGDETRIILEGNWGLGESVVQGKVIPDKFVINKETLSLEEKSIGTKLRQFSPRERGIEEEDVPPGKQSVACLSDREAIKIGKFAKLMESHYGFPVDIEWAVDRDLRFSGNIFLTQVRPATVVAKKKSSTEEILDMLMRRHD
jgi:pyruvate,water dikinase